MERRRGRVVRAARLWCRKSPYRVKSRLGSAMRRLENSVNQAENGYLFRIREGQGSERRGMGSAFHQLCWRYSGTLTPIALRLLGNGKPLTFFLFYSLAIQYGDTLLATNFTCQKNSPGCKYSWLSLSRSWRDPMKQFEISVLRHIRFSKLRTIQIALPNFTNEYVIRIL